MRAFFSIHASDWRERRKEKRGGEEGNLPNPNNLDLPTGKKGKKKKHRHLLLLLRRSSPARNGEEKRRERKERTFTSARESYRKGGRDRGRELQNAIVHFSPLKYP